MTRPADTERKGSSTTRLVVGAALSAAFRALFDWLTGR